MENEKVLSVSAIENGTVIDHIPAQSLFKVISLLNLDKLADNQVTFGYNLKSKQLGMKAIIKVSEKFFEDIELDKIALVAPNAKLNIIKNYNVVEKRLVKVPEKVIGIAHCMNPKCITNHEKIPTKFTTSTTGGNIVLRCCYCDKCTDIEHAEIF
ncbi:MAG: aspartate carbamoyltransferase regulatory subunit [Salinivirgaceae bacterium]|nr:aspartate carbamoyltransferase regulatory subunit [Salinivirgaceae bacterium]